MPRFILRTGLGAALLGAATLEAHRTDDAGWRVARDTSGTTVHLAIQQRLPDLRGDRLQVTQLEVTYPPGGASRPHRHPCAVIGYVVAGAIRSRVAGESAATFSAGQTFYEPPNGVHLVSANASDREPATLLATFVCDTVAPLSTAAPDSAATKGRTP